MKYVLAGMGGLLFAYLCGSFIKADFDFAQWTEFARSTTIIFGIYFSGMACVCAHFMEKKK